MNKTLRKSGDEEEDKEEDLPAVPSWCGYWLAPEDHMLHPKSQ